MMLFLVAHSPLSYLSSCQLATTLVFSRALLTSLLALFAQWGVTSVVYQVVGHLDPVPAVPIIPPSCLSCYRCPPMMELPSTLLLLVVQSDHIPSSLIFCSPLGPFPSLSPSFLFMYVGAGFLLWKERLCSIQWSNTSCTYSSGFPFMYFFANKYTAKKLFLF